MLIKDWMTKNVLTVDANTSVIRATREMKENNVRRLPVLSRGKLVGMITDRDLKEASPSKTTSLDIHEMHYLLSEMKVKDVMTPDPICMQGEDSLEKAAVVMLENKISGIAVVDGSGHLIGMLSETDVLLAFIHSTGIKDGTVQYVFDLPDKPGTVTKVVSKLREHKARIISILTSFGDAQVGMKRVAIRVDLSDEEIEPLNKELESGYGLLYSGKDELKNLPRKKSR